MKKKQITFWEALEVIRNEESIDQGIDQTVEAFNSDAIVESFPSKRGFKIGITCENSERMGWITSYPKSGFKHFFESIHWMLDESDSRFNIECAKRWQKMLEKEAAVLKSAIEKLDK